MTQGEFEKTMQLWDFAEKWKFVRIFFIFLMKFKKSLED